MCHFQFVCAWAKNYSCTTFNSFTIKTKNIISREFCYCYRREKEKKRRNNKFGIVSKWQIVSGFDTLAWVCNLDIIAFPYSSWTNTSVDDDLFLDYHYLRIHFETADTKIEITIMLKFITTKSSLLQLIVEFCSFKRRVSTAYGFY